MDNTDIAYNFYKKVFNQKEFYDMAKWTNDTYYNSDGIYREPKVDTMEERIAFIRQFSGNLTAMAWLNHCDSIDNWINGNEDEDEDEDGDNRTMIIDSHNDIIWVEKDDNNKYVSIELSTPNNIKEKIDKNGIVYKSESSSRMYYFISSMLSDSTISDNNKNMLKDAYTSITNKDIKSTDEIINMMTNEGIITK